MDQEDTEKISFDCLRNMVDETIKTKNICIIEKPELKDNQLRYMQKYTELQVSKEESRIAFESYRIGMYSIVLAGAAVGASYSLAGFSSDIHKVFYGIYGGLVILISVLLYLWINKKTNDADTLNNIEFMHKTILKIEERLTC